MSIWGNIKERARYLYRSAITGRWVSRTYAEENPTTTTKEKIK